MEENNRKGPGVFYAVVGVATLVVAIIGATFAYFSASAPGTGSDIKGDTLDLAGGVLSVSVDKIGFDGTTATSPNLVPAWFGETEGTLNVANPAALTEANVVTLLTNKCENNGYTGCHVYRITATTTQAVKNANLLLDLATTAGTQAKDQWGYAVFTSTGFTGTANAETFTGTVTYATVDNIATTTTPGDGANHAALSTAVVDLDLHNNAELKTTPVVYYLLVYLNDNNQSQNDSTAAANYAVGGYAGNVELQAAGGTVRASFAA